MKTTPAQAAARAENGRKHSTGPKTPEGKAASRANAIKSGAYAKQFPVIPHGPLAEDPDAYEQYRRVMIASLNTVGTAEEEVAAAIADAFWRRRRIPAVEAIYLATAAAQAPPMLLEQARWLHPWNESAARVLRDPDGDHSLEDLKGAAIAAGHAAGVDMDDDWPQPMPTNKELWNQLIDATLAAGDRTRDQAAERCDRLAAEWRDRREKEEAEHRDAEIVRIVEGDLLIKTSRAEAHLGRELSRLLGLLWALQADRKGGNE